MVAYIPDTEDVGVLRFLNKKKCGEIVYVICQGKVIEWDGDVPVRMIGTHTDVTKEVKVQHALEQEQKMLEDLFEFSPTGIVITSPKGEFLKVNQAYCKITGRSEDDLLSKSYQDITHPDDYERDKLKLKALINGEIDGIQVKKRYIKPDGSYSWVQSIVVAFRDQHSEVEKLFVQVIDINDQYKKSQIITNTIEDIQGLLEKQNENH